MSKLKSRAASIVGAAAVLITTSAPVIADTVTDTVTVSATTTYSFFFSEPTQLGDILFFQPNFPYSIPPFGYPTDDNFSVFFSEEARYTVTLLGETGPIGGAEDAASYFYSFDSSLSSDTNHGSFGDRQTHIFLQGSEKGFILNETVTADISCSNMDYCSVGGPPDPNFVNIYSSQETNWGWGLSLMAPVPEPSTWAMLLIGFVGIGFMLYRRRRALVTVA